MQDVDVQNVQNVPPPPSRSTRGRKGYRQPIPPYVPTPQAPINPSDIVPETDQNVLMHIDYVFTTKYFEVGDIALRLSKQAPQVRSTDGKVVTIEDVYRCVGFFCHRQPRTVRLYSEVSAFFSPEVRAKYNNVPFSVFVLAKTFGDDWEEILQYAEDCPWASESQIRFYFHKLKAEQRQSPDNVRFHVPVSQDVSGDDSGEPSDTDIDGVPNLVRDDSYNPAAPVTEEQLDRSIRLSSFALSQLSACVDALSSIGRGAITERAYVSVTEAVKAVTVAIQVVREEMSKM